MPAGGGDAPPIWDLPGIEVARGAVLTDRDYEVLGREKRLVERFGSDKKLKDLKYAQAALEVHLSEDVEQLIDPLGCRSRVKLEDGFITIRPGQVLSIGTQECFNLPTDIQGQVSPKGSLTTIGLFFPTTHVDPGYHDHLYLPVFNAGPNTAQLPIGLAIGKVELQRLTRSVQGPWGGRSGFRTPASELVEPGETPDQRLDRLRQSMDQRLDRLRQSMDQRLDRLRQSIFGLRVALAVGFLLVLSMLLDEPVGNVAEDIDWNFLTSEVMKAYVAPAIVSLLTLGLVLLIGLATRDRQRLWRRIRLLPPDDQPKN